MSIVQDTYDWLERVEGEFVNRNVPFSDRQVSYLIGRLRLVEPYLKANSDGNELYNHFACKMEMKFLKENYHQRFMLFDFIKNLIHEELIKKGIT